MKSIQIAVSVLIGFSGVSAFSVPVFESVYGGCTIKLGAGELCPRTKVCELRILKTDFQNNTNKWEDFRAEVQTSFSHGRHVPGDVVIKTVASDDKLMQGKNAEASVNATLNEGKKFESLRNYSLDWDHGDHAHTHNCFGLKVRSKAP